LPYQVTDQVGILFRSIGFFHEVMALELRRISQIIIFLHFFFCIQIFIWYLDIVLPYQDTDQVQLWFWSLYFSRSYCPWTLKNITNYQFSALFFSKLSGIHFIFGTVLCYTKLPIYFKFGCDQLIFLEVIACGLKNITNCQFSALLLSHTSFADSDSYKSKFSFVMLELFRLNYTVGRGTWYCLWYTRNACYKKNVEPCDSHVVWGLAHYFYMPALENVGILCYTTAVLLSLRYCPCNSP
jgi:hypothetical protein